MLCLKKRRTYSFTQGSCVELPRRSKKDNNPYDESLNMAIATLPRKNRSREERPSRMVLTVTEDTPADMLAGSMELLVQLPRDHNLHAQRVTVQRSTPMMDLLVQIATAQKLAASSYTLQAIGERGLVLPHQPNTPIGALDALQVKLLPKQGTFLPRKSKQQANQPFETTFRLQVHLPRNQLYVSRVSPKMNLGEILDEVCREKNLDRNKYELRHPANLEETLDLSLSLQDYHLQEVTLYAKQGRTLGSALSSQDIMALQRQEDRRRQQAKQSVFGFIFKKSKESSLSTDSLGGRSVSPARSDETARSASPLAPPARPVRKRRPAPKPPVPPVPPSSKADDCTTESKDKMVISHSRNSSDSSGYHEASVLSDNPDPSARLPETLPRRSKPPAAQEAPRKLAQTAQTSKSLGNIAVASGSLGRAVSTTSLSSTGLRKKRAAPPPPVPRPLSSAISTQALERIVDSEESLTSDMDHSKPPSDIAAPSKADSDIDVPSKANSDIGITLVAGQNVRECIVQSEVSKKDEDTLAKWTTETKMEKQETSGWSEVQREITYERQEQSERVEKMKEEVEEPVEDSVKVEPARVPAKRVGAVAPVPKPRKIITGNSATTTRPVVPMRRFLSSTSSRTSSRPVSIASSVEENVIDSPSTKGTDSDAEKYLDSMKINVKEEQTDVGKTNRNSSVDSEGNNDSKSSQNNVPVADKPGFSRFSSFTSEIENADANVVNSSTEAAVKSRPLTYTQAINRKIIKGSPSSFSLDNSTDRHPCSASKQVSQDEMNVNEGLSTKTAEVESVSLTLRHAKSMSDILILSSQNERNESPKKTNLNDRKSCMVISTIPKCDHLSKDESAKKQENQALTFDRQLASPKRAKIFRSQSELKDFEENSFKKQKKHLTSYAEDFAFALNPNLPASNDLLSSDNFSEKQSTESTIHGADVEGSLSGLSGVSDKIETLSETDILLQKVSDTLSNALPAPPSPILRSDKSRPKAEEITQVSNEDARQIEPQVVSEVVENKRESKQSSKDGSVICDEANMKASTPNMTIGSQQDTSDYVSAVSEDLSMTDWEYQLPDPPSAFRDTNSPVCDDYDTITLRSVEAFKEPVVPDRNRIEADAPDFCRKGVNAAEKSGLSADETADVGPGSREGARKWPVEDGVKAVGRLDDLSLAKQSQSDAQPHPKPTFNLELKKEMISELESKIETGTLPQSTYKEAESKRIIDAAPAIAPVENSLSNFKITTYARQKSLNIFDEVQDQQSLPAARKREDRVIQTFATLSRNKNSMDSFYDGNFPKNSLNVSANTLPAKKIEKVDYNGSELRNKWQSMNGEKSVNVTLARNKLADTKRETEQVENAKNEISKGKMNVDDANRSASVSTNLEAPKSNEKFAQWRDNILKRQEEPTKEKQLQSYQVLKSILPQLKQTQQADENAHEDCARLSEKKKVDARSNERTIDTNVVSNPESHGKSEPEQKSVPPKEKTKLYTYNGPPSISLGSWSERPSANVQIKMDTDYKFGKSNYSLATRTFVNINSRDQTDSVNRTNDFPKTTQNGVKEEMKQEVRNTTAEKKEPDDLARKLITHTTASGFKKPILNKVNVTEPKSKGDDRPVVTGIELKKNFVGRQETTSDTNGNEIDTTPVNFKELTKAFGQEVCLRAKPKYVIQNRHSDYYGTPPIIQSNAQSNFKQNGIAHTVDQSTNKNYTAENGTEKSHNLRTKRYTSVVGINNAPNQNWNNINAIKVNQPMPVVKGFHIQPVDTETKNNKVNANYQNGFARTEPMKKDLQAQKPSTVPVITGVTLKSTSARPKTMPVNVDSRDILLESIRNFGGSKKLKSVPTRY